MSAHLVPGESRRGATGALAPGLQPPGRQSLIIINSEIISTFKVFDVIISAAKVIYNLNVY